MWVTSCLPRRDFKWQYNEPWIAGWAMVTERNREETSGAHRESERKIVISTFIGVTTFAQSTLGRNRDSLVPRVSRSSSWITLISNNEGNGHLF